MSQSLHLVTPENRVLAEIAMDAGNRLQLTVHNESLETPLRELLSEAEQHGIKQRMNRKIKKEGATLIVEDLVTVMPGDADFLKALADYLSGRYFGTQRVFSLIKID